MSDTLKLVVSFVLVPVVALICDFVFTFGLTQILTIQRLAIPFSKSLKKDNNVVFSNRIYFSFLQASCFWVLILAAISYIIWVYTNLKGGLAFGALLGLFNAVKNSSPTPDKEPQFFDAYGKFILGYDNSPKRSSHLKPHGIVIVLLLITAIAGWYKCFYYYQQQENLYELASELSYALDDQNLTISGYIADIEENKMIIKDLSKLLDEAGNIIMQYDNAVVFIPTNPNDKSNWLYHTIDCPILLGEFITAPMKDAVDLQFTPCSFCHSASFRPYVSYNPT